MMVLEPLRLDGMTDRDILIAVHSDMRAVAKMVDDHEDRLRQHSKAITEMETTAANLKEAKDESAKSRNTVIAWGMLLAAIAGGFGDAVKHWLAGGK